MVDRASIVFQGMIRFATMPMKHAGPNSLETPVNMGRLLRSTSSVQSTTGIPRLRTFNLK